MWFKNVYILLSAPYFEVFRLLLVFEQHFTLQLEHMHFVKRCLNKLKLVFGYRFFYHGILLGFKESANDDNNHLLYSKHCKSGSWLFNKYNTISCQRWAIKLCNKKINVTFKWFNEHELQQLCTVHRPISHNKFQA